MNLIRLLLLIALIWLAWRIFIGQKRRAVAQDKRPPQLKSAQMVRCDHCGLFVATDQSYARDGRFYCSPEHRDAD